jgi:hypothetical protein
MLKSLQSRLEEVERQTSADMGLCFAWAETNETAAEAEARAFPEGLPDGARLTIFQWRRPL